MKVRVVPTEFASCGETIHGDFVLPEKGGPFPGICKFHGLPGSSDQIRGIASALAQAGFAVLTFDFRGFRRSEGSFSLAGEIADANAAISHVQDSGFFWTNWLGAYGASFGGAVTICCAATNADVDAVCVRAPVYDTESFSRNPMIMEGVKEYILDVPGEMRGCATADDVVDVFRRMREDARSYNPMRLISRVSPRPILLTTGDADELIDVEGVKKLYEAAGEPKEFHVVSGADHILSRMTAQVETTEAVVNWFRRQIPEGEG
jgi:dipeptidyl aminopeptidase/acylaminoacyl peptidase